MQANVFKAQAKQERQFKERNKNRRDAPSYKPGDLVKIKARKKTALGAN